MAHKLYRLLDSVYNTPHLVTEAALKPIVEYLQNRNSDVPTSFAIVSDAKTVDEQKAETVNNIGEIQIDGVLTYKPIQGMCGPVGVSYQGILEQATELIEMGVDTIVLTHSSPGGQAAHCFSTALDLRDMCDENDIRLISYIDTLSASASLALGVVADEVIIHPSASTGSIGCVCCIVDQSKALEKAGLKPIYVASTPGKTPFQEDGSFSKEFLAELQEDVTRLGNQFAGHVSSFTGIPVDEIIAMDAKMFHADKALELGLVNKIMDHKQFAKYLAESTR
jgi:ClpP class serine protease